jgi:hypothetical protein
MTTQDIEFIGSPSDSVREIATKDGAALLDIRQGLCLSMTSVGVGIWRRLKAHQTLGQISDELAAEFQGATRQQICRDVSEFVSDLRRNGLLSTTEKMRQTEAFGGLIVLLQRRERRARAGLTDRITSSLKFLVWKAFFGLLAYDCLRFGKKFSKVHGFVQQWPMTQRSVPTDVADQASRAMNYACVWYPKRVLCLQRSAVLTCLLRSCGVPAQMVIGAQKFPFAAHAWTEVDGRPINETVDIYATYFVWERC